MDRGKGSIKPLISTHNKDYSIYYVKNAEVEKPCWTYEITGYMNFSSLWLDYPHFKWSRYFFDTSTLSDFFSYLFLTLQVASQRDSEIHIMYLSAILGRIYRKNVALFVLVLYFGLAQPGFTFQHAWPKCCFCKLLLERSHTYLFICCLCPFLLRQQSCEAVTELITPIEPKIFPLCSCAKSSPAPTAVVM